MREDLSSSQIFTGGNLVYNILIDNNINLLIGLPGTQTLPLDRVVTEKSGMSYVMARHETSIPHIAWGYYEATGKLAATLTIPGPGDTNAMHGLKNAYNDRVPIVHISAEINPEDRRKKPIHEISPNTYDNVVKDNFIISSQRDLNSKVVQAISTALTVPRGPVRIGIPSRILADEYKCKSDIENHSRRPEEVRCTTAPDSVTDLLTQADKPLLYIGNGARRTKGIVSLLQLLSKQLNSPVLVSHKGKGVYPEDDPHFLGISGRHLPAGSQEIVSTADVVLALGANFNGITTNDWKLPLGDTIIHVDQTRTSTFGEYDVDLAINADIAQFVQAITDELSSVNYSHGWDGAKLSTSAQDEFHQTLAQRGLLADNPLYTPGALLTIRDSVKKETIITTDIGGFRLWAMQLFTAYSPNRYITAGEWAGMGIGLPSGIGAKLGDPDKNVVVLTGDGGLMMSLSELHAAAEHNINITVVTFDNSDYGIISKSPKISDYSEDQTFAWDSPDFEAIVNGFNCNSFVVSSRTELADALSKTMSTKTISHITAKVPTTEPSITAASEYESEIKT